MTPRPKRQELMERDAEILTLWAEGMSFRQIEKYIGGALTYTGIYRLVKRYQDKATVSHVRERREREAAYLEQLRSKLQERVDRGEVEAIAEGRRISESMRKLYGLDVPLTQHVAISDGTIPKVWDAVYEAVLIPTENEQSGATQPLAINPPSVGEVTNGGQDTSPTV